jgi:uncharacterized protein YjlB
MSETINPEPKLVLHQLSDDGIFPNNSHLPLVVYAGAFEFSAKGDPSFIEKTFAMNGWGGSWRNGIYPFHHYHSTAHEVLGVYSGSVRALFGGEKGTVVLAQKGDVVVIPAGVAHKNLWSSFDFRVVGAYPPGQSWDMNYGNEGERPRADRNIEAVPMPPTDPIYGKNGFLISSWMKNQGLNSST